jgi:hypothetical protein
MEYGTLPDFTLRRIANLETMNARKLKGLEEALAALERELGEGYLKAVKEDQDQIQPQIIIAIENQKL